MPLPAEGSRDPNSVNHEAPGKQLSIRNISEIVCLLWSVQERIWPISNVYGMAAQKNETTAPTGPRILHSPQKELHTLSLGDAESIYWLLTLL